MSAPIPRLHPSLPPQESSYLPCPLPCCHAVNSLSLRAGDSFEVLPDGGAVAFDIYGASSDCLAGPRPGSLGMTARGLFPGGSFSAALRIPSLSRVRSMECLQAAERGESCAMLYNSPSRRWSASGAAVTIPMTAPAAEAESQPLLLLQAAEVLAASSPTIDGCLELAATVQGIAISAPFNSQRCARLSRRVRNLIPLLEKLGPKLTAGACLSRTASHFVVGVSHSSMGSETQGHGDDLSPKATCSTQSFGSGNAVQASRPSTPPRGASSGDMASRSPSGSAMPSPSSSLTAGLAGPRTNALLLHLVSSSSATNLPDSDIACEPEEDDIGSASFASPPSPPQQQHHQRPSLSPEEAEEFVAVALVPKNSCTLPASVLDALAPGAGTSVQRNERLLADPIVADCHSVISDSLSWIATWGWNQQQQPQDSQQQADAEGVHGKVYMQLSDRLSAAFSDLMYLALAYNINVEHQPGRSHSLISGNPSAAYLSPPHTSALPASPPGSGAGRYPVRDLVIAIIQQEWREQSLEGRHGTGYSSGEMSGGCSSSNSIRNNGESRWLRVLSVAERSRVDTALSAQGLGSLSDLVHHSVATLAASVEQQQDRPTTTPAMLACQLLAILPQPPIPASSLAHAQEPDSPWLALDNAVGPAHRRPL